MCIHLHPAEAPDHIRRILYFALRPVVAAVGVQPVAAAEAVLSAAVVL